MNETDNFKPSGSFTDLFDTAAIDSQILVDEKSSLIKIIGQLSEPEVLNSYLDMVLNDPITIDSVLKHSYKHQNGFHKIVLNRGNNFKIRLHVFDDISGLKPMENIHNHRWNFVSHILCGELKMEIFEPGTLGSEIYYEHLYEPSRPGSDKYEVNLSGLSFLKLKEVRSYPAYSTYFMDKTELHRVINDSRVRTIVMTGREANDNCKLFSKSIFQEDQKVLDRYSKNELVSLLEQSVHNKY